MSFLDHSCMDLHGIIIILMLQNEIQKYQSFYEFYDHLCWSPAGSFRIRKKIFKELI